MFHKLFIVTIASISTMLEAVKSNLSSRPVALFPNVDLCNEEKKINFYDCFVLQWLLVKRWLTKPQVINLFLFA